ncbi:MAG: hypothetical protein AAF215_27140 [Cyanobacteria bacterium P01_A01_bin.123]
MSLKLAVEGAVLAERRAVVYGQVWLADLAMAQEAFQRAESLLEQALPVLEKYQDQRCLALCRKSYALLEQARGNPQLCRTWAKQALEGFERLGMEQEAVETKQLITSC